MDFILKNLKYQAQNRKMIKSHLTGSTFDFIIDFTLF